MYQLWVRSGGGVSSSKVSWSRDACIPKWLYIYCIVLCCTIVKKNEINCKTEYKRIIIHSPSEKLPEQEAATIG